MNEVFPSGMLSDTGIRHYFLNGINIFTEGTSGTAFELDKQLHEGSVDLRVRHIYHRFNSSKDTILTYSNVKDHDYTELNQLKAQEKLRIEPGEIILTTTLEIVQLSAEFAALITGRSSIARLGLMVHCCQEFIHPGHGQTIPLQIVNLGPNTVELDQSVPICQIVFFKLSSAASKKYVDREDAKYSGETDPMRSKIFQDYENLTIDPHSREENLDQGINNTELRESKGKKANTPTHTSKFSIFLNRYIVPFIPALIMLLVITPFMNANVVNKNVSDVLNSIVSVIKGLPAPYVIAAILFIIFIIAKRGDGK